MLSSAGGKYDKDLKDPVVLSQYVTLESVEATLKAGEQPKFSNRKKLIDCKGILDTERFKNMKPLNNHCIDPKADYQLKGNLDDDESVNFNI